jgi:hypothetical protein
MVIVYYKKKINVYRIGSCRTNYLCKKDDINTNNYLYGNFTHTTKEVIQQIKMLNNEINIHECEYPKCFTTYISKSKTINGMYNDADVILIELSSIKEVIDNAGFYYNIVELMRHYNPKEVPTKYVCQNATLEDVKNDISIIKSMINKPIIFQGHINMNFINNTSKLSSRKLIDQAISNELNLTYENIFGDDKEKVCTLKDDGSIDPNHLTKYAYNELYKNFVKILKENNLY